MLRLIEHAVPAERGNRCRPIARCRRRSWYVAGAAAFAAGMLILAWFIGLKRD